MYYILHIPTGNYVQDNIGNNIILKELPEDRFDRADILRQIIVTTIPYSKYNKDIKASSAGLYHLFSEFTFIEAK